MDLRGKQRVLIFGGTFDPPHVAHVVLPMLAAEAIGFEHVLYIPAAQSPHKQGAAQTPAQHRLAMLRLALAEAPWASISTLELDRFAATGEPSYTVDTLAALRQQLGPTVKLRLLIGTDQMLAFDRWKEPQRIIELAEPVVMLRPPQVRDAVVASLPQPMQRDGDAWSQRMIDLPVMDVSATNIRARIAAHSPVTGLLHPAVERYIDDRNLYVNPGV